MKRRAKANYKRALRQVDKENLCAVSNDLEECLLKKDHLSFWKTWNAKFSCKRNVPVCIDGFSNNDDIANLFATCFEKVCTPNSETQNEALRVDFESRYIEYVNKNASRNDDNETISVELVDNCIREAEHILHAHPVVVCFAKSFV